MLGYDMYLVLTGRAKQSANQRQINTEFYTKKFVMKLIAYEKDLVKQQDLTTLKMPVEMPEIADIHDPITEQIMDWIKTEPDLGPVRQIVSALHNSKDLPALPDPPAVDKSNPAPYFKKVVVVGEQIPVGKNQKPKPKQKPVRKNNKEKPILYEGRLSLVRHAW